jgi:glycogen synthase
MFKPQTVEILLHNDFKFSYMIVGFNFVNKVLFKILTIFNLNFQFTNTLMSISYSIIRKAFFHDAYNFEYKFYCHNELLIHLAYQIIKCIKRKRNFK